jgi:LPXTG-site transpeptidase (sortase) family protein
MVQHIALSISLVCLLSLTPTALTADDTQIIIPDLKIVQHFIEFPLGYPTWEISPWEAQLGHLEGTATFDSPGNVVLAAHSEMPDGSDGLFAGLDTLRVGSWIIVNQDRLARYYRVVKVRLIPPEDLTLIYPSLDSRLTLITCDVGSYNPAERTYGKRIVVTAVLVR